MVVVLTGCQNQNAETVDQGAATNTVLGVEELVRNPAPDEGAMSVKGVVLTVTPEDNLLTLIDVASYKSCGLSDCCLYLPVRWTGDMPVREEAVLVTGAIEATDSGMVFIAHELQPAAIEESL